MPHTHISRRLREATANTEVAGGGGIAFSLEFFLPDSPEGVDDLRSRIVRLSSSEPVFIDICGVGGLNEARRALRVARYAKKVVGLPPLIHVSAAELTIEEVRTLLTEAREAGVNNVLAERGAPLPSEPEFVSDNNGGEVAVTRPSFRQLPGGFHDTSELVSFIRTEFGGFFCIGVTGYPPSGRGEYGSYEEDLAQLRSKQDAGAEWVLVQHVLRAADFARFSEDASRVRVTLPCVPCVLPVQSFDSFVQANVYCGVEIPPELEQGLREAQASGGTPATRAAGLTFTAALARDLLSSSCGVAGATVVPALHIHTFNLESVPRELLRQLGLGAGGARRRLPWRPSGDEHRADEDVRPIFWANRPESYLERTASWAQFPSGRWSSGPRGSRRAFDEPTTPQLKAMASATGSLSGSATGLDLLAGGPTPAERRRWWGEAPQGQQDVWEVFASYLEGKVPRLPWCDTPLALETGAISSQLVRLNSRGFLTINSQPRVNACPSDDATFGWGGKGGYVYQKAYVECFCPPGHLAALMQAVDAGFPGITYHAVDVRGNTYSNCKTRGVQAVTWGVFPGKEILQPTVVDPEAFLAWKTEAFGLWLSQWAAVYDDDSPGADTVHEVHDAYFLVNLVDNDFIAGDLFRVFEAALEGLDAQEGAAKEAAAK